MSIREEMINEAKAQVSAAERAKERADLELKQAEAQFEVEKVRIGLNHSVFGRLDDASEKASRAALDLSTARARLRAL
jgi:hypothetical protein